MENLMTDLTPFALFVVAIISAGMLAIALPFALWRYFRAVELAPHLARKAEIEAAIERLKEDIRNATADLEKLAGAKAVAKDLIAQGEQARQWLEANQKKVEDLRAQVTAMNGEYQIAKQQLEDMKGKVSDRQNELAETNAKLLTLEEKLGAVEKEHKDAVAKLEERQDALKAEISKLTSDGAALKAEKESLAAQVAKLKQEREDLKQQRDRISAEVAECRVQKERNDSLKAENLRLETQMKELRQKIADGESVIAKANTIRNNEANMWKDLERSVAIIEEEPASASVVSDQEQALQAFKDSLDASGYLFSERTIKAFHTGLLCGGVSPLVVLSGISGTGKSLLPELYAKAFSMNFLPVAVQPRWDGPQDVFGFYNHMEGRFKATELSRLLWQFDVYNNPIAEKTYGRDLRQFPMSLVLLDEMNLARVEYYFSELLSKLEIRNRVADPDDKNARVAAEIELEYGASSVAGSKAEGMGRRLFVGRNILFVGTMNEDESTQTLSSKVIDRSNVIRFGTPETLKRTPDLSKFEGRCKNFVSFGTWRKWAAPCGGGLVDLDGKIDRLKDALKRVDCGFGHRTENAVKQYVAFYPGRKEDALADQIEMKILPKLNGVETDLVRDKVRPAIEEILQSIGDTDVRAALDATLNGESTFFAWKGVRR